MLSKILDTGQIPDERLVGAIKPINKNKGGKNNSHIYRGLHY